MRKCKFESMIDDYLTNHLSEEKKGEYEEHYFNCQRCFEKMQERAELIGVVKSRGDMIFEKESRAEKQKVFSFDRVFSILPARQWAFATAAVAAMLVIFLAVVPLMRKPSPQFTLDETSVVRGEIITSISPVGTIDGVPSRFTWAKVEGAADYKLYLYSGNELFWTVTTEESTVALPLETAKKIKSGRFYSWLVKAFSTRGTLVAASSKAQFIVSLK